MSPMSATLLTPHRYGRDGLLYKSRLFLYLFKVLDDGSVVHINKTTIADTDENGNSFFFHRAVIHNIGNPDSEAVDTPALEESQEESQGNQGSEVDDGVDAGLLNI